MALRNSIRSTVRHSRHLKYAATLLAALLLVSLFSCQNGTSSRPPVVEPDTGDPTRYGTKTELVKAVAYLKTLGIDAYYDVVFNHRMGADYRETVPLALPVEIGGTEYPSVQAWTGFHLPGRQRYYTAERWGELHHTFNWNWRAFNGTDYVEAGGSGHDLDSPVLFQGKSWPATFGYPYLMGNDVDYWYRLAAGGAYDPAGPVWAIRDEMKAWGRWIIQDIGFAGFRMDATAHVDNGFVAEWVDYLQNEAFPDRDLFFVAEAWVGNIAGYIDAVDSANYRATGGREGMNSSSLRAFDFGLRSDFVSLSSGSKDMRNWGGLEKDGYGDRAVTFVDNHDTNRAGNPYGTPQVDNYKNQAYAYMLMRNWTIPTVYARDWDEFGMAPTLRKLVEARRYFAYGDSVEMIADVTGNANTQEVYAFRRAGDPGIPGTGLVLLLSGRNTGGAHTHWVNTGLPEGTEFVDITGNRTETVEANVDGWAPFTVNLAEGTGWSVWVQKAYSTRAAYPVIPADQVNQTVYQFFYWDAYPDLWKHLSNPVSGLSGIARDLATAGVTGVWLPPAARAFSGRYDVGYGVKDFWDLGEEF